MIIFFTKREPRRPCGVWLANYISGLRIINATSYYAYWTYYANVQLVTTTCMCTICELFCTYKTMDAWLPQHLYPPTSSRMQHHGDDEEVMMRSLPHKGCHWTSLTTLTTHLTMRIFFHQILTLSRMTPKNAQTMVQTWVQIERGRIGPYTRSTVTTIPETSATPHMWV